MKYFLDQEFLEDIHKPLFGRPRHFIDLISIGIVAEDGREFYAICKEFNLRRAWNSSQMEEVHGDQRNQYPHGKRVYWIRENVLRPIFNDWCRKAAVRKDFTRKNFARFLHQRGQTTKEIARSIIGFTNPDLGFHVVAYNNNSDLRENTSLSRHLDLHNVTSDGTHYFDLHNVASDGTHYYAQPEFYAFYADYDWVLFCSLFGRMKDLPKGFSYLCIDLKQMMIERGLTDAWKKEFCPDPENEHHALADARWNKKLFVAIELTYISSVLRSEIMKMPSTKWKRVRDHIEGKEEGPIE